MEWMDGWMVSGSRDETMDGWTDGWTDGWMNRYNFIMCNNYT